MNTTLIKFPLAILLFWLCSSKCISQTRYLDSLDILIKETKSDTIKILQINVKIERLREINLDSALLLAQKNLKASRSINFLRGELYTLITMAGITTTKGDYQTSENVLKQADSLAKILNSDKQKAKIYSGLGILYGTQGEYDRSNVYFKKLIAIYEKTGDSVSLSRSYANLAIGYQMQADYPQTLFYQQKALRIMEAQKNEVSQSYLMMNMGNTYQFLQDTLKSEQCFLKGIKLANKHEIKNVALYGYSNLGSLYTIQNKWQETYDYTMLAAQLGKEMGDESMVAASMAKAAKALMNLDKSKAAEALATKAITLAEKAGQPLVLHQTNAIKGEVLTLNKKYKEAIPFLEKSIKILKDIDNYEANIAEIYANLSLCYEKTGKYNRALTSYKISAKIKDSVRSSENIRKATELSMNYDFEKKEALAKAKQDIKDAQVARSKNRQLYLILGLGVLVLSGIVIALILYKNNKQKQKANLLLKRQKLKVEKTLAELKTTQTQLIQSEKMASLGELTAGIAHEIQNPLNFVNNFSEVSSELIEEMKEELNLGDLEEAKAISNDLKQNLEKINHHGKRAEAIVKGMLQHSRDNSGEKEDADINKLADEYLRLAYHGLRAKNKSFNATLDTYFDSNLGKINIVSQDIGRVLLNLFTNAFYAVNEKQSNASTKDYKPTVSIKTLRTDDTISITIKDNGDGISKDIIDKIFQPFFTTKPTGKGTGLGLSMSYDIIKAHHGTLDVKTEKGSYTEFTITLPNKTKNI